MSKELSDPWFTAPLGVIVLWALSTGIGRTWPGAGLILGLLTLCAIAAVLVLLVFLFKR